MKQRALSLSLAFAFVISSSLGVVAQSEPANERAQNREELRAQREEIRQETREAISAEREQRITERCVAAQERVQAVIERAQSYRENHTAIYDNWRTKITSFLERLAASELSVDTTQLSSDLSELDGLIEELRAAFTDYETQLNTVATMDCTDDPQQFQDALTTAREYRSVVVSGVQSVREYISSTIKADLQAIKDAITDGAESEEG